MFVDGCTKSNISEPNLTDLVYKYSMFYCTITRLGQCC